MRTLFHIPDMCPPLLAALLFIATPSRADHDLPPVPTGVTELKFSDFFVTPVGPRGLELTDRLKALHEKRVRILGYMVRAEHGTPGVFLLTPLPVQLHDHDSALADDLPPSTVWVIAPDRRTDRIPYTPRLMLLTGTLSLGNREEADGRISVVRLTLDQPAGTRKAIRSAASGRGGSSGLMPKRNFTH